MTACGPTRRSTTGKASPGRACRSWRSWQATADEAMSASKRPASPAWPAKPAKSPVFFRLQLKAAPREAAGDAGRARSHAASAAAGRRAIGDNALGPARGRPRARAGAGDVDLLANDDDRVRRASSPSSKPDPRRTSTIRTAWRRPVSPYQLMAGTVIAASLVSGLNSDLPGFVIAQVTEHVYDTVSGRLLLIPQGSRLIGKYDNVVAFGQERALVVWQRIILPDGSSIVIDNLPATDTGGYAGLADERRPPHLEAAEGRRARHRARRRQPSSPSALPTATSSRRCSSRRKPPPTAPASAWSSATSMSQPTHHRAPGLAAARDRPQGHRAAALPSKLQTREGGKPMPVIGTFSPSRTAMPAPSARSPSTPRSHPSPTTARRRRTRPISASWLGPPRSAPPGAGPSQARTKTYLRVKLDDPACRSRSGAPCWRRRGWRRPPAVAARTGGRGGLSP